MMNLGGGLSPTIPRAADAGAFTIRPEGEADAEFAFALFAANNAPALARSGLPLAMVGSLIDMQFRAQREHYRARFPDARRSILELAGRPIGRLVVAREGRDLYVVDIAVLPEVQDRGIGGEAVAAAQREAAAAGLGVRALVMAHNAPSLAMFRRRGFTETGRTAGPSLELRWTA